MSTPQAQRWADAFLHDLAHTPGGQRRALIDALVAQRGQPEREQGSEQMRVLSLPETTPGAHPLARYRLAVTDQALSERIAELVAVAEHPNSPDDARSVAAMQVPGLIEFAAVITQAGTASQDHP